MKLGIRRKCLVRWGSSTRATLKEVCFINIASNKSIWILPRSITEVRLRYTCIRKIARTRRYFYNEALATEVNWIRLTYLKNLKRNAIPKLFLGRKCVPFVCWHRVQNCHKTHYIGGTILEGRSVWYAVPYLYITHIDANCFTLVIYLWQLPWSVIYQSKCNFYLSLITRNFRDNVNVNVF